MRWGGSIVFGRRFLRSKLLDAGEFLVNEQNSSIKNRMRVGVGKSE
jgi:hypothetical protein